MSLLGQLMDWLDISVLLAHRQGLIKPMEAHETSGISLRAKIKIIFSLIKLNFTMFDFTHDVLYMRHRMRKRLLQG